MRAHASRYSMRSVVVVLVLLGSIGAVLLVTSPTASALTYVRGVITVDTTWGIADTTYIVTGPVTVRAPRTLTITPGTTVKLDSGVHLFIEGRLMADGTGLGIQVEFGGSPAISRNTITNVSGTFAIGILVTSGAAASIDGNSIRGVRGSSGGPGSIPGASGRNGSFAAGIYAYGVPSVSISSNTIDTVIGGRGGEGHANPGGPAGRAGSRGAAAGIVVPGPPDTDLPGETIANGTAGSRGARGGGGTTTHR